VDGSTDAIVFYAFCGPKITTIKKTTMLRVHRGRKRKILMTLPVNRRTPRRDGQTSRNSLANLGGENYVNDHEVRLLSLEFY
jgi:hypothetical protein